MTFENLENTAVIADILCEAVSVRDVTNEVSVRGRTTKLKMYFSSLGRSVGYVMGELFSCSSLVKSDIESIWLLPKQLKFEAKKVS